MQDNPQKTIPPETLEEIQRTVAGHKTRQLREADDVPSAAGQVDNVLADLAMTADRCMYCGQPAEFVCTECDKAAAEKNRQIELKLQRQRESTRRSWFTDKIPELYQHSDDLLLPAWVHQIVKQWNPQDVYGVTIVGPSSTSKTRGAVRLLEKAFVAGRQVEYRQAGDLRRDMNRLARDGGDSALLKELGAIPVLIVDDLGNQAWTESSEEFFLALFEARANQRLTTFVTSQFPADEFIGKTSNRRIGTAIARRIGPDFNWMVNSQTGDITPPNPPKY